MNRLLLLTLLTLTINAQAGGPAYPLSPDPILTPGSMCERADRYRHPENIAYCEREVNSYTKETIFLTYRRERGFRLNGDRAKFKIDHFIPLCFGGSNDENNLWPQHASISIVTDTIESVGCEKLGLGKIKQKELITLIKKAKLNLAEAPKILKYLKKLK